MSQEKTSTTAYAVVAGISKLAGNPRWRPLMPEGMAALSALFTDKARDAVTKDIISLVPEKWWVALLDRFFIPGMAHHFLFRKKLIDERTEHLIAQGVRQVVVIGGGFDTLMLRKAKVYPAVRFFELDLPVTGQAKVAILREANQAVPSNASYLALNTSAADALRPSPGFDPAAATLIILEGVLMYLPEAEVRKLFTELSALCTGKLTILFSAIAKPDDATTLINRLLRKKNEATLWSCPSESMPDFAAGLGYALEGWMPYRKLQRFYRSEAEIMHVPEEDENYYIVVKTAQSAVKTRLKEIPFLPVKV